MKQISYLKTLAWHRILMLVGFLMFRQGIGWAADDRTNLCPQFYYDINGDGILEYFDTNGIYTIDGKKLYNIDCGTYSMGLLDKNGQPLLVTAGPKVWDYKTAKYIFSDSKLKYFKFADIDGDGRKELVEQIGDRSFASSGNFMQTYHLQNDGTFVKGNMFVTSDTTTIKSVTLDNYTPNSSGSLSTGIGTVGGGMFVEAKPFPGLTDWEEYSNTEISEAKQSAINTNSLRFGSAALDLNGDGLEDLMDYYCTYYNLGNNTFLMSSSSISLFSADLTGNGLVDYVKVKKNQVDLCLNKIGSTQLEQRTLLKNSNISTVFFGDFDKDGDVDILILIPGSDYLIFQFYRNDGNGVFKPKDYSVDLSCDEFCTFYCGDYDGDGLYEVFYRRGYYDTCKLFKCNKDWTVTESVLSDHLTAIGDFNNDGITELLSGYNNVGTVPNSKQNTRPAKMEKPTAVLYADAGKLKLSWSQGKDAETSSCDLTYELRIGTESGKGDIFLGESNTDGTRRTLSEGNMGCNLKYLFNANRLSEGKYYIAIQAIDAGGLGGPWSDELVYEHKINTPSINILGESYCTTDTITFAVQNPIAEATYEWKLSHGTIISQNSNNSAIQARFDKAGKQNINLSMMLNGKEYKAITKEIFLFPIEGETQIYSNDCGLLDIDQDGIPEVYEYESFYEYKNGSLSQIRKTWNVDLDSYKYAAGYFHADFNHDGFPDFYTYRPEKNMFINSGEQDKAFEYSLENFTFNGNDYYMDHPIAVDLNNNGHYDLANNPFSEDPIYSNTGDDRTYKRVSSTYGIFDFNRDGSFDLWKNESKTKAYRTTVRFKEAGENNQYEGEKIFYESSGQYKMKGFADFNNDGYVDGYYFDAPKGQDYYNLVIVKGKPIEEWPCTQTIVIPLPECSARNTIAHNILDYDNNGYLDIWTSGSTNGSFIKTLYLMDKDFHYIATNSVGSSKINECYWQPLTPGAYPNGYKSNIKNEAPNAPTNVTATSIPEGLLLKWDDATDDHTPWMQMRYNVSLKIKGNTGENAFVLSPMNGLSDDAAICSGVYYRKASQLIVPKSALVNGTTYELQVQAIDLMGEHSPMTKPVEVTYNAEKIITIDNEDHYTDMRYYGKCSNVSSDDFTLDAGEGGVIEQRRDGGIFRIMWKTPGIKTITIKDGNDMITKMVNVKLSPDLTIDLPEQVMLNTPLTVKVPECFQTGKFDDFGFKESEAYKATFEMGDTIATIVFKEVGEQTLLPYIKMENSYSVWKQLKTTVIDETMPTAEIKSVESNGKYYQVNWSTAVPSMVSKVEISRETNRLNQFEVLDIVPVGNGSFVDLTSDNRVQPQRYRIRLAADNEIQMSDYSIPHNPLHVMINKTADKQGNNLMWNAYEGLDVQSYTILRGSSENNLKAIATIAGSQQNYTDYAAPEGVSYYAVKFETMPVALAKGIGTYAASDDVTSNVISSEEAMPTTAATNLYAGTVESNAKLTTDQQELHMVATILPTYVTYNKVSWSIVSGGEYASISQSGLLTAKGGKGDVVVRVVTLDGSNLSDEITIPCDVTIMAKDIDVRTAKKSIAVGDYLLLNAVLTPKNTTMSEVTWKSEDTDIATVDENGILKAITPGVVKITATTKDGSNLSAYINIIVTEPTGINGVIAEDKDADTIYYDLEGKKIQTPTKGNIYITNKGKKVVF